MVPFASVRRVLEGAAARRVFSCAAVEVGATSGAAWTASFGTLTYDDAAPPATSDTIFDLASLTKVLATTSLVMRLVEARRIDLQSRVSELIAEWRSPDRETVTIRDLLAHASGLPAYEPLHLTATGRSQFERAICRTPLAFGPGTRSIYSDLGFMLLGFIVEDAGGAPLDVQFARLVGDVSSRAAAAGRLTPAGRMLELRFELSPADPHRTAPTRFDSRLGRARRGEVDDENAAALGGVAGHAGLFGTAAAVGFWVREVLGAWRQEPTFGTIASGDTVRQFATKAGVPGSSRALGWDTMLPSSSCGSRMSATAFGHTGFTGTSLWIDPASDVYAVLLTNRVHPAAEAENPIQEIRRAVHDAVMEECQTSRPAGPSKRWDDGLE
jgi:CubicO group peptidase (beta-lactamase class C family)